MNSIRDELGPCSQLSLTGCWEGLTPPLTAESTGFSRDWQSPGGPRRSSREGGQGRGLAGPREQAYICYLQGGGHLALPAQDGGPAGHALGAASSHPTPSARASPLTGPQTVDNPSFLSTGTRLMAPSMCWVNTSQSRSKRPKAKSSDTWGHGEAALCRPPPGARPHQVATVWTVPLSPHPSTP